MPPRKNNQNPNQNPPNPQQQAAGNIFEEDAEIEGVVEAPPQNQNVINAQPKKRLFEEDPDDDEPVDLHEIGNKAFPKASLQGLNDLGAELRNAEHLRDQVPQNNQNQPSNPRRQGNDAMQNLRQEVFRGNGIDEEDAEIEGVVEAPPQNQNVINAQPKKRLFEEDPDDDEPVDLHEIGNKAFPKASLQGLENLGAELRNAEHLRDQVPQNNQNQPSNPRRQGNDAMQNLRQEVFRGNGIDEEERNAEPVVEQNEPPKRPLPFAEGEHDDDPVDLHEIGNQPFPKASLQGLENLGAELRNAEHLRDQVPQNNQNQPSNPRRQGNDAMQNLRQEVFRGNGIDEEERNAEPVVEQNEPPKRPLPFAEGEDDEAPIDLHEIGNKPLSSLSLQGLDEVGARLRKIQQEEKTEEPKLKEEKKEQPQQNAARKNFFDMDDDEEEAQPNKAEKKSAAHNQPNVQNRDFKSALRDVFRFDDEEAQEEEEEKADEVDEANEVKADEQQQNVDRRAMLEAENPHLFMANEIFNPNVPIKEQIKEEEGLENLPQKELTEEEKRRRAEDDARMERIMADFKKSIKEIDDEDAAIEEAERIKAEEEERLAKAVEEFDKAEEAKKKAEEEKKLNEAEPNQNNAPEENKASKEQPQAINYEANISVFKNKLTTFNNMYKSNIDADKYSASIIDAWALMTSGDPQKMVEGRKQLGEFFKDTLKQAFDVERKASYEEFRLPEYIEIIKDANELMRAGMFAFTDLYHNHKSEFLFAPTSFAGLSAKSLAQLTTGESLWKLDQESDKAWEIQSKEAKDLAAEWLKDEHPFEKMIQEMNALAEAHQKNGSVDKKESLLKLTAAEWLLTNDSRMMITDPADPINPIPNWGNRYWKTLTSTREALGINKYASMRDLIQKDYTVTAKAVNSLKYNAVQIRENVLATEARSKIDSMDKQKEQFATLSAHVDVAPTVEAKNESTINIETMPDRIRISVESQNQRTIMKNEPKSFNFVIESTDKLTLNGPNQNM